MLPSIKNKLSNIFVMSSVFVFVISNFFNVDSTIVVREYTIHKLHKGVFSYSRGAKKKKYV